MPSRERAYQARMLFLPRGSGRAVSASGDACWLRRRRRSSSSSSSGRAGGIYLSAAFARVDNLVVDWGLWIGSWTIHGGGRGSEGQEGSSQGRQAAGTREDSEGRRWAACREGRGNSKPAHGAWRGVWSGSGSSGQPVPSARARASSRGQRRRIDGGGRR